MLLICVNDKKRSGQKSSIRTIGYCKGIC